MDIYNRVFTNMYYIPPVYYWINKLDTYTNIKKELIDQYNNKKIIFYNNLDRYKKSNVLEKTDEYNEYKSSLIRLILTDYAHNYPNNCGKELLDNIIEKWKSKKIKLNVKEIIYNRTVNNILNNQKKINNIEEILMLINLQVLEYFYE